MTDLCRIQVAPSMMCASILRLEDDVKTLSSFPVDWFHIDVMDGRYVPNFTLGPDFCRALAGAAPIPLDIHLMVVRPDLHLECFSGFPGSRITFHPETLPHPMAFVQRLREAGISPGIAISPSLTLDQALPFLPHVDQVCVMTVNPGYAGQRLIPQTLETLGQVAAWKNEGRGDFDIEVDGNVSWDNIPRMVAEGAEVLVCGTSSIFQRDVNLTESLIRLKKVLGALRHLNPTPAHGSES